MSPSDELSKHLSENVGEEHLKLFRALALGGAAASLAILVQLLQVGAEPFLLKVTVLATSVSLPSWVTLSTIYELYIVVGSPGRQHFREKWVQRAVGVLVVIAAISLFVAVTGVFLYLMPESGWLFFGASVFCYCLASILWVLLARFFFHSLKAR